MGKFFFAWLLFTATAQAGNLHLIDSDPTTGFAIYRMGKPGPHDMAELCRLGITQIAVLSGNGNVELSLKKDCPSLKVIYNVVQSPRVPLSGQFLKDFDLWVEGAKKHGLKIAIRCNCGCHRTGRLAAYYQMKHQRLSLEDASAIMHTHGDYMWLYPELDEQVKALNDFIYGRKCSAISYYCVR